MNVKNKINKIKIPTATKTKMFHIKEIHILKCDWRQLAMFVYYIYTNIIFLLEKCRERNHSGDLDM